MNANIEQLVSIANKAQKTVIGLMSGTSMDGLDVVLCTISGHGSATQVRIKAFETLDYTAAFKEEMKLVFAKQNVDLAKVVLLNAKIGLMYADMVNDCLKKWGIAKQEIDFIASHGQTIYHAPIRLHQQIGYPNATLQIGDGDHIALKTGILTLSDFRQKNLAGGGEGAPLATYGDYLLYSSTKEDRVLLNIGGIANLSYIPKICPEAILSTDVGAGNTLIDSAMQLYFKKSFDDYGRTAQQGSVCEVLLEKCLQMPFFKQRIPKSTGQELFNLETIHSLSAHLGLCISHEDMIATLTMFTAKGIAQAITEMGATKSTLYITGGGAKNATLCGYIKSLLPDTILGKCEDIGINSDAKEALIFAVLANEALCGEPLLLNHYPSVLMGKLSFAR